MSSAVHDFWNRVEADEALAAELDALFTGENCATSAESIVALAKRHGFDFTTIALKEYIVTGGSELTEDELDTVSGGIEARGVNRTIRF